MIFKLNLQKIREIGCTKKKIGIKINYWIQEKFVKLEYDSKKRRKIISKTENSWNWLYVLYKKRKEIIEFTEKSWN